MFFGCIYTVLLELDFKNIFIEPLVSMESRRERPPKLNKQDADEFDEDQDIRDYEPVKEKFVVQSDGDCLVFMTTNYGDSGRLLQYLEEMHPGAEPVFESELLAAVRCESKEARSKWLAGVFDDIMLGKKVDRYYPVDQMADYQAGWPMQLFKSGILDGEQKVFRLMCAPRKLEQEFVIQVEDTCSWMNRSSPVFAPTNFTHAVTVVEVSVNEKKYLAWAVTEAKDIYVKPKNRWVDEKTSRAYYKLFEALMRFKVPINKDKTKAIDVGASPGGWTQCLVEKGMRVWAVDPAPLTLSDELMKDVVWLKGLSTAPHVLDALRAAAPFDCIVCDMNQFPDELARCFDDLIPFLGSGGMMIITIKLTHLRPEQRYIRRYSKGANRLVKYILEHHPVELVGLKWLLQNKNERTVVFRKK